MHECTHKIGVCGLVKYSALNIFRYESASWRKHHVT